MFWGVLLPLHRDSKSCYNSVGVQGRRLRRTGRMPIEDNAENH